MSFTPVRILIGVVLIAAVVALFFVVRPKDSNDNLPEGPTAPVGGSQTPGNSSKKQTKAPAPKPPAVPQIVIKDGQPAGGVADLNFSQGDKIRFDVKSDVAEEVHVHGYDISKEVSAGGQVKFSFPADITGVFEAELENAAVPIAEIQVDP